MQNGETKTVNIGDVVRPVPPVRDHFDEQELSRLSTSIRENGILVPLLCRPKDGKFEVIDGDRRLAAAWKAELREIPIMVRDLDDEQTHIQRMLANLDRHDPDPVSEAKYIAEVIGNKTFTIEEFASKLGRTIDWVEGRLTIAEMPPYMKDALGQQKISLGVCMQLHEIKDAGTKERYFYDAIRSGMTVHAAKVNKLIVNEAIEALAEQGKDVTEETVPTIQTIPNVRCAYTGEILPVTSTRSVRVGIENHKHWQTDLEKQGKMEQVS